MSDQSRNVLVGKRGMLFLDNDSNKSIAQITGTYPLASNFATRWKDLFRSRVEISHDLDFRYLMVVAPSKEAVYSDDLPDGVVASPHRPVHVVEAAAAEAGADFVYPLQGLKEMSGSEDAYSLGDTHWTFYGAYLAYAATAASLGLTPCPRERFSVQTRTVGGDLSSKIGRTTTDVVGSLIEPNAHLQSDNKVVGVGNLKCFMNEAGVGSCVVFRDSFVVSMEAALAETFASTCFVWQPNLDLDLIRERRPDYVISIMAERFLVHVPPDALGPSQREYADRKAAGVSTKVNSG